MENCYNEQFYASLKDDECKAVSFANFYIPELMKLFQMHSVIDIGGGVGTFVKEAMQAGVEEGICVDLYEGESCLEIDKDYFLSFDLNQISQRKDELLEKLGYQKYDLAVCLEVAEHLEKGNAVDLIDLLTGCSDIILFSAAIPYQGGDGHVNEQWPEYWEDLFRQKDYKKVDWFRRKFWDAYECIGYYRQNVLLYMKEDKISEYPQIRKFIEDDLLQMPRHVVHPTVYNYSVRNILKGFTAEMYPRTGLQQEYLENAKILADRVEMLKKLPKGGVFVEVGVANGDFSKQILDICCPKQLYCIDIWWNEENLNNTRDNLQEGIEKGIVKLCQGDSIEELGKIPEDSVDFIYLDAVHDYEHPRKELEICKKLVKEEGYIAGHDYVVINVHEKPILQYGVINAVNEFVVKNDYEFVFYTLEELYSTPSYCLRKRYR